MAPGSARLVVEPMSVAVVRRDGAGSDLPPTVTLGGPAAQSQQLLLKFPDTWGQLHVDAAFLLLEPASDATPTGSDVRVSVALAGAPWSAGASPVAPTSKPPTSTGLGRTRPPAVLRVDVTLQLRALQTQPDHGLVVSGEGEAARGAVYLTGADGAAPRLDVYGRPIALRSERAGAALRR